MNLQRLDVWVWQLGVFCGRLTVKTCKAYGGVMLDKDMIDA